LETTRPKWDTNLDAKENREVKGVQERQAPKVKRLKNREGGPPKRTKRQGWHGVGGTSKSRPKRGKPVSAGGNYGMPGGEGRWGKHHPTGGGKKSQGEKKRYKKPKEPNKGTHYIRCVMKRNREKKTQVNKEKTRLTQKLQERGPRL